MCAALLIGIRPNSLRCNSNLCADSCTASASSLAMISNQTSATAFQNIPVAFMAEVFCALAAKSRRLCALRLCMLGCKVHNQPKVEDFVSCGSVKLCKLCPHKPTHTLTLTLTHTLTNCDNALTGPQLLEQAASGSVNGENAAQPAANASTGVDGSASAQAIQVCTTLATFMRCFADSHACMCSLPLHIVCSLMPSPSIWSFLKAFVYS